MPNDMYKEYQGLAGSTDPMAIQRRRELARGIQAQRRGQPVSVAPASQVGNQFYSAQNPDPALRDRASQVGNQFYSAQNMPTRPANFPGNRLPVAPMRPGDRMGQVNEAGLRAFNPDTQFKIDQILSRFPRR